jgi:uncharacterized protein with HEPN domain
MQPEISACLSDIMKAINEINQFLPDRKDFIRFQNDLRTRRAIERNIEIIGEAIARIVKNDPAFPIHHARKIIDTMNTIIHGYDTV